MLQVKVNSMPHVMVPLICLALSLSNCGLLEPSPDIATYMVGDVDYSPTWSPRGDWIAFRHGPSNRFGSGLYLIDPDGNDERIVVAGGSNPGWSYTDDAIALSIFGSSQFYKFSLSDSSIFQLTSDTLSKHHPTYHPHAQQLLFSVFSPETESGVWSYDISTNEYFRITEIASKHPQWNPQGDSIVFFRTTTSGTYLSILDYQSGELTNLFNEDILGDGHIRNPSFSPDGHAIAFNTTQTIDKEATIWTLRIPVMPTTQSGRCRPPIPGHADHSVRSMPTRPV